jgi:hypothetical protein
MVVGDRETPRPIGGAIWPVVKILKPDLAGTGDRPEILLRACHTGASSLVTVSEPTEGNRS